MIETKAATDIPTQEVQAKAKAALKYCENANEFIQQYGGKPWKYAIIPHDQVAKNSSFKGIVTANLIY